jgi:hypothetical protein
VWDDVTNPRSDRASGGFLLPGDLESLALSRFSRMTIGLERLAFLVRSMTD